MARKSTKTKTPAAPPYFQSEAEEADWLDSPAGRRFTSHGYVEAMKNGVIESEARTPEEARAVLAEARVSNRVVRFLHGYPVKPTDPAVLQQLMDSVKAKQTQAVSLRLPVADIEAAKALAVKVGVGYQTLLKEIISNGLRRAS
jgi:hypothetical protein